MAPTTWRWNARKKPCKSRRSHGTWLILSARKGKKLYVKGAGKAAWLGPLELESLYMGNLLDLQEELPEGGIWNKAGRLLFQRSKDLCPLAGLVILSQALAVLTPQWTRLLVDQVFPASDKSLFHLIVIGALVQSCFSAWLAWLQGHFTIPFEHRLAYALERGVLSKLFSLPYPFFRGRTPGELLQGLHGLAAVKDYLVGHALSVITSALSAGFFLFVMLQQLPGPALFVVAVGLGSAVSNILAALHIARLEAKVIDASAMQWSYLVELFNGLPKIKVAGVESLSLRRWSGFFWKERQLGLRASRIGLWSRSAMTLATLVQSQILNLWCALAVLDSRLSLGAMLAFTMMAGAFQAACGELGSLFTQFMLLKPQLERTREILEATSEPLPRPNPRLPFLGRIKVDGLAFRYAPELPWLFHDFNLEIEAGARHRLPGPSGAGKSTLLKILAGLLPPAAGQVRLGDLHPRDARGHLAYLPQDLRLFQGSILENLRIYSCDATRERIMEVAHATGLAAMVEKLPMSWETRVSLGGGNFSGGQRQLLALTGVLASARPLLLLDEAMANLDPIQQERLLGDPLFDRKTIIYASHGISFPVSSANPFHPTLRTIP